MAAATLAFRQIEVLAAVAPQRRVWADRVRTVEMPIFAGYIFGRFNASRRAEVEKTAGIASIVRFGDTCCPVEDAEIAALRIVLGSGLDLQRAPFLCAGRPVEVKHGPLAGVRGIVLEVKNRYRLVVSITLLQRSVSVEIDEALVQPLWSPVVSTYRLPTVSL